MIFSENRHPLFGIMLLLARLRIYEFRVLVNPLTIGRSRHQMGFVERARGLGSFAGWWADVPAEQARLAKPICQAIGMQALHASGTSTLEGRYHETRSHDI